MIAFVKCYSRRVHFTSNSILRKITYKSSSNKVKVDQQCSNDKSDSTNNQNINSDYFGIESEEGVITIETQKHSLSEINRRRSLKDKERFHNTAFGIVRYDSENKLKYHGQYNSRSDFIFPHKSTDIAEVQKSFLKRTVDNENQFEKELNAFTLYDKTENNDETGISTKINEDDSYIDQCYFGTSVLKNSADSEAKQSENEDLSLIDQEYFKTLDHSVNSSADIKVFPETIMKDSHSEGKQIHHFCSTKKSTAENLNFFDQNYFRNIVNSENEIPIEKESFMSDLFNVSSNKRDPTVTDINQHIITEKSEMNAISIKESTSLDKSNSENLINNKNKSVLNELPVYFNQYNINSIDTNSIDENIDINQKVQGQKVTTQDSLLSSETSKVSNLKNHFSEKLSTEENNVKDKALSFHNENFMKDFENNNMHDNELSKGANTQASKSNVNSPKKVLSSVAMDSDISSKLDMKVIESFSKKGSHTHSMNDLEESKQDDVPSAHDFVQDLRENQRNSLPNSLKRKSISGEKTDSKGFRILKNQVQDLSNFTQAEILCILKQNIVYSDDDLLVLNKPYSLVMHESETTKNPCLSMVLDDLAKELDKHTPNPKLFTVHRLDKETTGCLLLARNETMAQNLKYLFAERKIIKKYWVVTIRVPEPSEGVIDIPISEGSISNRKRMVLSPNLSKDIPYKNHTRRGKPAITSYKVISESGNAALIEVTPVTGIKHQIRVHFGLGLGCPILGDHKYSHLDKLAPQKLPSDMLQRLYVRQSKVRHIPMHIHAKSLIIPSYFERRDLIVHVPLPHHMTENLKRLRFKKKN